MDVIRSRVHHPCGTLPALGKMFVLRFGQRIIVQEEMSEAFRLDVLRLSAV
jgi:hypothetical protein